MSGDNPARLAGCRDALGKLVVELGLLISTPRTRARVHAAMRRGMGMSISPHLARVADLAREPGE